MQASTFFGTGEQWKEPWTPPVHAPNGRQRQLGSTLAKQEYGEGSKPVEGEFSWGR
jgi:hypothetical protein